MIVQDLQERVRDKCWVAEISMILAPDIVLFISDGSQDAKDESHLDRRREAVFQLKGKFNTQNAF